MSKRCQFIYDDSGIRHPDGTVLIDVDLGDGAGVRRVQLRSAGSGPGSVTLKALRELGIERVSGVTSIQSPVPGVPPVVVPVDVDVTAAQGRAGRKRLTAERFDAIVAERGAEAARALADRHLAGLGKSVGESAADQRAALVAVSGIFPDGVLGAVRAHPNVAPLVVFGRPRAPGRFADRRDAVRRVWTKPARDSADPAERCAWRSLYGPPESWVEALVSPDVAEQRMALLAIGSRTRPELLSSLVDAGGHPYVRAAALTALHTVDPLAATEVADRIVAAHGHKPGGAPEATRLLEHAVAAASLETQRAVLDDPRAFWLWKKTAIGALDPDSPDHAAVLQAVAADTRAHPQARSAALAKLQDRATLRAVAGDPGTPVPARSAAIGQLTRLGEDPGTLPSLPPGARPRTRDAIGGKAIGMVAMDIDGTLLDATESVHPRTAQALQGFTDSGGQVAFVTTRPAEQAIAFARQAMGDRPALVVCDDGALVCDARTGTVLRGVAPASVPGATRTELGFIVDAGTADPLGVAAQVALQAGQDLGAPLAVGRPDADGRVELRWPTDKASGVRTAAALAGVGLHAVAAFGDGAVDLPMFSLVADSGGVTVAVGDGDESIVVHPAVNVVAPPSREGGPGAILESLMGAATAPPPEREVYDAARRAGEAVPSSHPPLFFSQYVVDDIGALTEQLGARGLEHLTERTPTHTSFGGAPGTPGHVTWAFPGDFPKGTPIPPIPADATATVIGVVDRPELSALVVKLEAGGVEIPRPSGEGVFHVTVKAVNGIPPVHTNKVIELHGWAPVEPFPLTLIPVERKGA